MTTNHLLICLFLLPLAVNGASQRNITIDDVLGDPITGHPIQYLPRDAWNNGRTCSVCEARLDESFLYQGTWTDNTFTEATTSADRETTSVKTATVSFNGKLIFSYLLVGPMFSSYLFLSGTAVYVQCIIARTTFQPVGTSDMQFFLDGQLAGDFTHNPPGTLGYDYNVTVFSKISLEPGEHELRIQNGRIGGPTALILLDAIIYTQNVDDVDDATNGDQKAASTPARSRVIPVAIGSTVGALLVLGLSVFFHLRHRRPSSTDKEANVPTGRRLFTLPSAPSPITPYPSHLVASTDRLTQELKLESLRSSSAHYRSSNILGPQHSVTSDGSIIPFVSDNRFSSGQPTVWDVSTPASSRADGAPPPPYEGRIVPNRDNVNRASADQDVKRHIGNPQ